MAERDLDLVITSIDPLAKGVLRLTLARQDGGELPVWDSGAHIDLHFVSRGAEFVRHYSLCGPKVDRHHWQVAVLLVPDGRGGSAHIHKAFAAGGVLRVTGPRNNFPLVSAAQYLFIAGGIGITPILPMIADVSQSGGDWRLLYSGRSADSMAFRNDVVAFGADKVLLHESDTRGLADLAAFIAETTPATEIYCCGPEAMLRAVEEICALQSRDHVHMERFSASEALSEKGNTEFEVEFARSGIVITVPANRSILDVAGDSGVDIVSSCQEGVCGTCETKVIEGVPDHRDSVLNAKERAAGETMMVCVSRSCSARLVLDA